MYDEILVNITADEVRAALVENSQLQEVHVERERTRGLVGNIYMGRVIRVVPGIQAAFIDIGLDKAGFLHASDIGTNHASDSDDDAAQEVRDVQPEPIQSVIKQDQLIPVQVIKDQISSKGARLTTQISLPARYLVYMPTANHIGISQRLEDNEERERLHQLIDKLRVDNESFIARTAAEGVTEEELTKNIEFLRALWKDIQDKMKKSQGGSLLYEDCCLVKRVLRDFVGVRTEKILIDDHESFQKAYSFCKRFMPASVDKIEQYSGGRPIFELYNIEAEIKQALERKHVYKSGAYLVFDQTEAMTTIDVNTGAFVGKTKYDETIFKTNLEAVDAIVRQIRLRSIGGIIIIDFIDMIQEQHRKKVLEALEVALKLDPAKSFISEISSLGLVQMTRKRTRESLEKLLCRSCSTCHGRGFVKTPQTICYEIYREIIRVHKTFNFKELLVLASQEILDQFLDREAHRIAELSDRIGCEIKFQVESSLSAEFFDVILIE